MTDETVSAIHREDLSLSLSLLAGRLEAMLLLTCADDGDAFQSMNEMSRINYLHACHAVASEIRQGAKRLGTQTTEVRHG